MDARLYLCLQTILFDMLSSQCCAGPRRGMKRQETGRNGHATQARSRRWPCLRGHCRARSRSMGGMSIIVVKKVQSAQKQPHKQQGAGCASKDRVVVVRIANSLWDIECQCTLRVDAQEYSHCRCCCSRMPRLSLFRDVPSAR